MSAGIGWGVSSRAALVALVAAAALCVAAVRVARRGTVVSPVLPDGAQLAVSAVVPEGVDTTVDLEASAATDPFSPDRGAPAGDDGASDDAAAPGAAAVRLLGTVVLPGGGIAICQLPGSAPRLVHVGERIGDLTLTGVRQGEASFRRGAGAPVLVSLGRGAW